MRVLLRASKHPKIIMTEYVFIVCSGRTVNERTLFSGDSIQRYVRKMDLSDEDLNVAAQIALFVLLTDLYRYNY
jgi:hypothetical protein